MLLKAIVNIMSSFNLCCYFQPLVFWYLILWLWCPFKWRVYNNQNAHQGICHLSIYDTPNAYRKAKGNDWYTLLPVQREVSAAFLTLLPIYKGNPHLCAWRKILYVGLDCIHWLTLVLVMFYPYLRNKTKTRDF